MEWCIENNSFNQNESSNFVNFRLCQTCLNSVFTYLLHEKDENLPEDLDEVNEEVKGVGNEVLVSVPCLSDDHLGVKHDEPAEDSQPNVQMSLQKIYSISVQLVPVPVHLYATWKSSWDLKKMLRNPRKRRVESPERRVPPR